jgi:glutaredoxin
MEKSFLDEKGVAYEEVYVDDDDAKKAEMVNLSGQMGTPVTRLVYDDGEQRQFVGFNPTQLADVIAGKKTGDPLVQSA